MSTEPCGGLPEIHLSAHVSYCMRHMAWCAGVSQYRQVAEDDLEQQFSHHATFGPFDAWEDVQAWVAERFLDPSVFPA